MFLFKNTKNLVKRIIMNVAVYGWIGASVIMLLSIILPSNFHQNFYFLIVISSFLALSGTVVSIVWSIVEFFVNILSENKGSKPTVTEAIYPVTSSKVENKAFTSETFKEQSSVPEDKSDAIYHARMDFECGGSPSFESSLGNRGMFTCSKCHNVLPHKYLHSNGICASCATKLNIQIVRPTKNSNAPSNIPENPALELVISQRQVKCNFTVEQQREWLAVLNKTIPTIMLGEVPACADYHLTPRMLQEAGNMLNTVGRIANYIAEILSITNIEKTLEVKSSKDLVDTYCILDEYAKMLKEPHKNLINARKKYIYQVIYLSNLTDQKKDDLLFWAPAIYDDDPLTLPAPDYEIHVFSKAAQKMSNGAKIQTDSPLPAGYKFAQNTGTKVLHLRMINNPLLDAEAVPLFTDPNLLLQIFTPNIRLSIIDYETAKNLALQNTEPCSGIVINPGGVSKMISISQLEKERANNMNYKKLFVSAELDFFHQSAVIIDLETNQFYDAIFSRQQTGGAIGDFFLLKTGGSISCEQIKALAEKSEDNCAKKYLKITNDNWQELINEKSTNLFAEYTISYHKGRFIQLDLKYKLLFCVQKENDNLSKSLIGKVQKEYEDTYAVHIDSEDGTLILSHAKLIQLGAASTDKVVYAKVISFDEMKNLLLYELDFHKALVERWTNEKDIQRANLCQQHVEEFEKILNTKESDWKDLLTAGQTAIAEKKDDKIKIVN